jgi:hypothetical protein
VPQKTASKTSQPTFEGSADGRMQLALLWFDAFLSSSWANSLASVRAVGAGFVTFGGLAFVVDGTR